MHEGKHVYQVVGMSADEYASKELQEWREQEAKKDIEVILPLRLFVLQEIYHFWPKKLGKKNNYFIL